MAVFWDLRANPPLILRGDDRCSASCGFARHTVGSRSPPSREEMLRRQHVPPQSRGTVKSNQISDDVALHFVKISGGANNINNLLDALGQQPLKIS